MTHDRDSNLILVPLPASVRPATEIRGTMLTTSYQLVRTAGLDEAYRRLVPPELESVLPALTALSWYPISVALAHYGIMDALFPEPEQQIANGRRSSEVTQNAHLKTLLRSVSSAGAISPLDILKRTPKLFERMLQGGAAAVWHTGPKDARVELHGFPLVRLAYVRNAWQGMFESAISLFSRRCFVRQDARFHTPVRMALVLSWV